MHIGKFGKIAGNTSILILVISVAACSSHTKARRSALPDAFTPPATAPDFSIPVNSSVLAQRVLRSKCKGSGADMSRMSGLMAGSITRPETIGGVYLDRGRMADGTRWFLHRAADDPEITYCGVALIGSGEQTNVSVTGIRFGDMTAAKTALESGDFLCTCKQLSE